LKFVLMALKIYLTRMFSLSRLICSA